MAVLVPALAGLTYALLNRGDGGDASGTDPRGGGASSSARTGGDENLDKGGGETAGRTDGPAPPASASGDGDGDGDGDGETTPPPQSVRVTVEGAHTEYSGACPPPRGRAPASTATFTVGRLPAEVSYRWVSEDGSVADPGWRTPSSPRDGGHTEQDTVIVTTYSTTGMFENRIGVEVREPVRTRSDSVPFSATCETEAPSDGASPSRSGSVTAL